MHIIPYSWNLNYFSGKHFPTSSWNTTLLLYYFRGCCSKIPHLAGLNNRHLFSHRCVGWRSRIKVLAGPCAHHVRVLPFTTEPVSFRFKYLLLLIKLSPIYYTPEISCPCFTGFMTEMHHPHVSSSCPPSCQGRYVTFSATSKDTWFP